MEAKIQGIFQTISRILLEYEKRTELCTKLKNQIEDHNKQLQICQSINIEDLNINYITEETKILLLNKLEDKLNNLHSDLEAQIQWFESNCDLVQNKLKKCFEQNISPNSEENIKFCQQMTQVSEISHLLNNHAQKCKYLVDQNSNEEDVTEENIDEIFGLSRTKPEKFDDSFDLNAQDKQKMEEYLDLYFSSGKNEVSEKPVKTPKRK